MPALPALCCHYCGHGIHNRCNSDSFDLAIKAKDLVCPMMMASGSTVSNIAPGVPQPPLDSRITYIHINYHLDNLREISPPLYSFTTPPLSMRMAPFAATPTAIPSTERAGVIRVTGLPMQAS